MKRILAWLLIAVMVVGCVAFAACGGGGGGVKVDDGGATTTGNGGAEPTDDGGGNGNGGGDDLEDIVGQAAAIDSVNYVMRMTTPGVPTVITEVWMKGDKLRTETTQQGQTMVYLVDYDAGVAYMYMPQQNMAYRIDISQVSQPDYGEVQDLPDYNPTIIGTETVDGKVCLVVQYSYAGTTVKGWIWKEHGFPVKMEMTTAQGKTTIEYLDIDFGNIPDSMFELPGGVQILQMPG